MTRSLARALLGASISASLAACSGGVAASPSVAPVGTSMSALAHALAPVSLTIAIPTAASKAQSQHLLYVSSGTKSVAVSIAPVGTVAPPATVVDCGTTCSVTLNAPLGNDLFKIALYDGSGATGNKLSYGESTQMIASNQTNVVRVSLGGIVAGVTLASIPAFAVGTPASSTVSVLATDAAGFTIIGSDALTTPISLTTSDTSGAYTVSASSLTTPSSTANVVYSGANVSGANVTAFVAGTSASSTVAVRAVATSTAVKFGTFARANGTPPFGMFTSSGALDPIKTQNIVTLGATWTRMSTSPFYVDQTIFGSGRYDFANIDTLVSWQKSRNIEAVTGIEAGPVQVNSVPGTFSPKEVAHYATATDFATYCTAIATHMKALDEHTYSEPGNEVNTNPQLFPNGASDVAAYGTACYKAIKAIDPSAVVYGLELNMDGQVGATAFVAELLTLGCGPGTCYDGISAHLSIRYPTPPVSTPCYPNPGGDYGVQCLADLRTAAGAPVPMMIGETVTTWPGMVADAATKALSDVAGLKALAATGYVKYINYANVDECALYPSGYFMNGCLIDVNNVPTPSWQPIINVFHGA